MDTPFPTLSPEGLDQPAAASTVTPGENSVAEPAGDPTAGEAVSLTPAQILRDTLALALEQAPQMMDNLIGRALLGMDRQSTAQADGAQRKLLDSSAMSMDGHRRRWVRQFSALLRVAFAYPLPAEQAAHLPIADVRICEVELAELERLLHAAGSLRGNPMSPQTYVRAMGELIARSEGSPQQRHIWGSFLLGALGTQLAWVYLQLNSSLRTPGGRETSNLARELDFEDYAAYVFGLGGTKPPEPEASVAPQPVFISPEMRALAEDAKRTVQKLRVVLGLPDTPAEEVADEQLGEMARMMRDIEEAERLMIMMQERGLQMPEDESPEVALQKRRDKVDRLLSEYRNASNAALQRLAQPVRDAMAGLHASLERLSERDASLFSAADHPARLLLQAIAQRGLQVGNDLPEVLTPFVESVHKLVDALNSVAQPTAKVFEQALGKVQPAWMQLDGMLKQAGDRQERSLAQLAVRKQLASRLAFELVSRQDASDAPVVIKQFLMGQWSLVLARAQLHPQFPRDEQRYEYVVSLLLWSASVRRAGVRKALLVELMPSLIQALRVGLASIEYPQGNVDAFLLELKKLHEVVLSADVVDDDAEDTDPPDPPSEADLSDMMMLGSSSPPVRTPPAPPSYQSDLNLL